MDIVKFFTEIVIAIIFLYIAFVMLSAFSEISPEFTLIGWGFFILMVIAVGAFIFGFIKRLL